MLHSGGNLGFGPGRQRRAAALPRRPRRRRVGGRRPPRRAARARLPAPACSTRWQRGRRRGWRAPTTATAPRPIVDPYFGGIPGPLTVDEGWEPAGLPARHAAASPAAPASRTSALFDERYFTYCEEADLGVRARHAGWDVGLVRGAMVRNPELHGALPAVVVPPAAQHAAARAGALGLLPRRHPAPAGAAADGARAACAVAARPVLARRGQAAGHGRLPAGALRSARRPTCTGGAHDASSAVPFGRRPGRRRHRRRLGHGPRRGARCSPTRAPRSRARHHRRRCRIDGPAATARLVGARRRRRRRGQAGHRRGGRAPRAGRHPREQRRHRHARRRRRRRRRLRGGVGAHPRREPDRPPAAGAGVPADRSRASSTSPRPRASAPAGTTARTSPPSTA